MHLVTRILKLSLFCKTQTGKGITHCPYMSMYVWCELNLDTTCETTGSCLAHVTAVVAAM